MFTTRNCLSWIFLIPVGLLLACGPAVEPEPPRTLRVKAFEVGKEALGQTRTLSGQLAASDSSPLSFGVGGTVNQVSVAAGDEVTASQVLATLDPKPLRLSAKASRAKLTGARAKLVEAEQAYERASGLLAQRAVAKADVEIATATLRSARASLEGAQSDLEQAERDLSHVELRAPFAGRIAERSVEPFQEIGANEAAFVLQSNNALVVQAQVPETLIRFVDFGQAVRVQFPANDGTELIGVVSLISAQAGSGNSFPIEVQLPTFDAELRPGMTASITFNFDSYLEGRTAYLIPLSAIAIDIGLVRGSSTESQEVPVFVFDEETSRLRLQNVRIGGLRGNELEVFEGLKPGDKVISAGVAFLQEGMEVELWSAEQGLTDG